jgi:DNA-binding NtrC family response regulator
MLKILKKIIDAAEAVLQRQPRSGGSNDPYADAHIVAASLCYRSDEGISGARCTPNGAQSELIPSPTLWSRVQTAGVPLGLVVSNRRIYAVAPEVRLVERQDPRIAAGTRLWEEAGTHILAWQTPVRHSRMAMVWLDISCPGFGPSTLPCWPQIFAAVEGITRLATPLLDERRRAHPATSVFPHWAGRRMRAVFGEMHSLAQLRRMPLLLQGPVGCGKTEVVQHLRQHHQSAQPWVTMACATVPRSQHYAYLFGNKGEPDIGSAEPAEPGLLDEAKEGVLFLDDIEHLDLSAQQNLVELLPDGPAGRVPDNIEGAAPPFRLMAYTSADLQEEAKAGKLHPALVSYFNPFTVTIPGLEERDDEIETWAAVFADELLVSANLAGPVTIDAGAAQLLRRLRYPKNLSTLKDVVTVACARMCDEMDRGPFKLGLRHLSGLEDLYRRADLIRTIEAGADAFVEVAEILRRAGGPRLSYEDDVKEMKSLVLLQAAKMFGRDEALRLLGAEKQVQQKNAPRAHKNAETSWNRVLDLISRC